MLFAGLTLALLVVFQRSFQSGLNIAREVEQTYGVALTPALLILSVMLVFHQQAKRRELKLEAAAALLKVTLAQARARELEELMHFGRALARALSLDALREAVWLHLPALSAGADSWLVLRTDAGWERLMDKSCSRWPAGEIERLADLAAARPVLDQQNPEGLEQDGHACFVMVIGERPVGVLALGPGPRNDSARQKMGAAAALLTIAAKNVELFAEVRDRSVKDDLTGCFTRTHALEVLDGELSRARRAGTMLSVVLFDVDQFKAINDRHGHQCGDSVLAAVGQRIRQVLRRTDVRCRYGGDEFLLVLPETAANGAARVAEWLRAEMEQIMIVPSGERVAITVSVGTATTHGGEMAATTLINRADQALYDAKAHGRNCVRSSTTLLPPLTLESGKETLTTH